VGRQGLRAIRGGRFLHLTGSSDKRTAAHRLIRLYQAAWQQPIHTVGLGDSLNDLSLWVAMLGVIAPLIFFAS
jgi:predicted mannosyl-3-phosphoglycerate phosphatase (HAD superfamily)